MYPIKPACSLDTTGKTSVIQLTMHLASRLVILFVGLLTHNICEGEETFPNIERAFVSELINNEPVTAMHIDQSGYLWIGSQEKLYSFDGDMLRAFSSAYSGNTLKHFSHIVDIAESKTGTIYASTYSGRLLYKERSADAFTEIDLEKFNNFPTSSIYVTKKKPPGFCQRLRCSNHQPKH